MRSRILSLALALCMIAVVFTALPTKAAVYYTGSVQTMDDTGIPKDVFFRGDRVYVNVTVFYDGALVDADIRVDIVDQNGVIRNTIYATTDDPDVGYFNSTESTPTAWLTTNSIPISGDMTICDIVLYVEDVWWWDEVAREQIIVRESGLSLDPPPDWYYFPGQDITITVTTGNTDSFYVQILNETDDDLVPPWTYQTVDDTGAWSETFTIPDDAKDGEYVIQVCSEATDAVWFEENFEVAKFALILDTDRWSVLPGEVVEIEYMVIDLATLALYSDVTVEWNAIWYNDTGDEQLETGELVPDPLVAGYFGTEEFTIPEEISLTSDYDLYFWANDTDDRTMETSATFSIGQLGGDVWTDSSWYLAGEVVTVSVEAWVDWDSLPGAEVDIVVEKDSSVLPEYGVTNLVTGVNGMVEHEFGLDSNASAGTYVVTATISKVGCTVVRMVTFDIDLEYDLMVEFDKDEYYSGQIATLTFVTTWGVDEVEGNSVFYIVYSSAGIAAVGNSTTGEATFPIDSEYVGWIDVEAVTIVNGYFLDSWDSAWVQKAYIAVAPAVESYVGGDTIVWEYEILTMMSTGLLSYVIEDAGGDTVASASLTFATAGTITYDVPTESASTEYTVIVTLKDGQGNNVEADSSVWLEAEYKITVWLESSSGYVTRAFEPGDEIEFGYEITTNGAPHMSVYKLRFYSSTDYVDMYLLTTTPTGTLTVTVSDDSTDGSYGVSVTLYGGVYDEWLSSDWVQFDIMTDQSGWSKEVAGMSAIDFTILVLIVVMIVLLIVVPFLKGKSGPILKRKKEDEPKIMTSMPPEQPPEPPQ